MRPDIEFHTEVTSVIWDEAEKVWEVTARAARRDPGVARQRRDQRRRLSGPAQPARIPGLDEFGGPAFHTARWPSDST